MRILYVVNNAAFFCSHRLPLALAARRAGHELAVVTGQAGSPTMELPALETLRKVGLEHHATSFRSGGIAPWREILGIVQVVIFMMRWRPDLVHCASPKGVLYGGIAARLTQRAALVLAVSGMGSLFTGHGGVARRLLRRAYLAAVGFAFRHPRCRVIVQNEDDRRLIVDHRLVCESETTLIPGSGVPLDTFCAIGDDRREFLVVLPARILSDKGVHEFVEAARRVRVRQQTWRFALVGAADYDNPTAIRSNQLHAWVNEGCIEWWGHCTDMSDVYARASIVCLPSYREGMPKALLEAAAAACAVVTTDTVGCREAIVPGETGDLVPVGDAAELADTLLRLIDDVPRRAAYGLAGRQLARKRFGLDAVVDSTLRIYRDLAPEGQYSNPLVEPVRHDPHGPDNS